MDAGRGSYCCGLVLGVALGVAGTHVALSGRPVRPPARLPDLSISSRRIEPEKQVELPGLDSLVPELRTAFAPEPSTVHAIATAPVETPGSEAPPDDVAPTDASAIEPPRQLPVMSDAEPLPVEKPREDAELRAFIRDELQTLAASEHDVWYETLRGLAREDATEILRIWKLTRGDSAVPAWQDFQQLASLPVPSAQPIAPAAPATTPAPALAPTSPTPGVTSHHAELRRLCHLNLANAATPGFKRRELMIFEFSDHGAKGSSRSGSLATWINVTQGKLTSTQRPLDCAIQGDGFFEVRRGDETLMTRCGRFVLDESGRISVPRRRGEPCPLEPAITVADRSQPIRIEANGEVRVLVDGSPRSIGTISLVQVADPSALEPAGDNLLRITATSGPARPAGQEERGTIIQGSIEESNVDPAEERRKLETLTIQNTPF